MSLRSALILVVFCGLGGCDSTLPLGTSDAGPASGDGGKAQATGPAPSQSGVTNPSPAPGGDSGGGQGTALAPSAACLGNAPGFGCEVVDGSVDPDTCQSDCESAAGACQVDSFTATAECSTLCAGCDDQTQVACLQGTSCSALVSALNGSGTLCGFANAGGGTVDPACCAQVCEHAAEVGCNVAESTANSECVTLCSSSPNWSQLNCVEAVPCSMLLGALSGQGSICGIGGPG